MLLGPERARQQSPGWRIPRQRDPEPWVHGRLNPSPEGAAQHALQRELLRPFRAITRTDSIQGSGGCAAPALGFAAPRFQRSTSPAISLSFRLLQATSRFDAWAAFTILRRIRRAGD